MTKARHQGLVPGLPEATPTGLEPAAFAVTGRRANQLRYGASLQNGLALAGPSLSHARDWDVPPAGFEPALPP